MSKEAKERLGLTLMGIGTGIAAGPVWSPTFWAWAGAMVGIILYVENRT